MDWNDFAQRLTLELSRLPVTSFIILQRPGGLPYVQAMRSENALDAEAVGNAFLPRPLAPHQERRLKALGWEEPDEDRRRNWWAHFGLRTRGSRAPAENLETCALLAGLMVGTFRDVYEADSPIELVYHASRPGPGGGPLALPGLGIAPAGSENEGEQTPAVRERSTSHPPGSSLEAALAEAREHGDHQAYLRLLTRAVLYLPASGEPSGAHQFATARFGDGTFVLAFTSPEAMDRSLQGQASHYRQASLPDLSRHWPHPEWQLAINPGLPSASYLNANALFESGEDHPPAPVAPSRTTDDRVPAPTAPPRQPAEESGRPAPSDREGESPVPATSGAVWTAEGGSSPGPRPTPPTAVPPRQPSDDLREARDGRDASRDPRGFPAPSLPAERLAADPGDAGVIMQKVLRPEHVRYYLEDGYDLVAGYVHRLQDVRGLDTPAAVIRGLALDYEGSPFTLTDERVFVVRWQAPKPTLFRRSPGDVGERGTGKVADVQEFAIESQRLPHGAELIRIDASGPESSGTTERVATYDADLRRWLVRLPGGRG
ncbi:SseB family protein [Actinomadura graeca]|uniref:SseB family protein n=1 Tax=Actinomadura graeca TaxID=2750812 RepID=A0ABX8QPV2_9ACTN|nr:SseB family protein [Actinomadura graeca]QXJ20833.1 SseB family protein [Actinomadura graeca]